MPVFDFYQKFECNTCIGNTMDSLYYQTVRVRNFPLASKIYQKSVMRRSLQLTNCSTISFLSPICLFSACTCLAQVSHIFCQPKHFLCKTLCVSSTDLYRGQWSLHRKRSLPCSYMLMGANK